MRERPMILRERSLIVFLRNSVGGEQVPNACGTQQPFNKGKKEPLRKAWDVQDYIGASRLDEAGHARRFWFGRTCIWGRRKSPTWVLSETSPGHPPPSRKDHKPNGISREDDGAEQPAKTAICASTSLGGKLSVYERQVKWQNILRGWECPRCSQRGGRKDTTALSEVHNTGEASDGNWIDEALAEPLQGIRSIHCPKLLKKN